MDKSNSQLYSCYAKLTDCVAFCTRTEIFANALFWVEVDGAPLIFTFDQAFANTKWRHHYWVELFALPTATAS